ncbi:hypothetical protein MWH28_02830 [Natroniella sulfidigena]|uniref:formyltransferase family protein n=1 Tax=Natroniella sulfidigena TaxID=723921 RepID=UPI00200A1CED|nr:formyltransferase family protein [Natroniella sulfidigena]MCK8816297.1 hypothetical protein [Natroniella sulfidigena]
MKKIVFFGSIPIATKCLRLLIQNKEADLLGVCCTSLNSNWRKKQDNIPVYQYCQKNKIRILTHSEILDLDPDLGISVRYHRIISSEVRNKFKEGIVNTHGGILPQYRGTYTNIHAIINEEDEYGVTLHYIDEGIDTGDIIDIKKSEINSKDTGFDLYLRSEKLCYQILKENLDELLKGEINSITQEEFIKINNCKDGLYKSKDISNLKEISIQNLDTSRTLKIIKAFDSPYHEPAFTYINGEKIYLRTKF